MNSTLPTEPRLGPPGAGLPQPELYIARTLFWVRRWAGNPNSFTARFKKERALIRDLYLQCGSSHGARRVLISRLPGMEDSSRHWSVWMTLDHLRIVNTSIAVIIGTLMKGETPTGTVGTAEVKPSPHASESGVGDYEASCERLLEVAGKAGDMKTPVRFSHPWFGPLDAEGWYGLAGGHMAIHRGQILKIGDALRKPKD